MSDRKALLILHGKQALNEAVRTAVENRCERGWELELLDTVPTAIDLGEVDGQIFLNMATGEFHPAASLVHLPEASPLLLAIEVPSHQG